MGDGILARLNLAEARFLDRVEHRFPTSIDTDTINQPPKHRKGGIRSETPYSACLMRLATDFTKLFEVRKQGHGAISNLLHACFGIVEIDVPVAR